MSPTRGSRRLTSSRRRRAGRTLAVSAAALSLSILPTACDFAYADRAPRDGSPATTGSGYGGYGAPAAVTDQEIVPVANTGEADPPEAGGSDDPSATAANPTATDDESAADGSEEDGSPVAPPAAPGDLQSLGSDCTESTLPPHDGFQVAPRCVSTAFGEVAAADRSPSLLIVDAPTDVAVGETFTISVSTRNLVRDRFLGAAAGGYYLESSFLDDSGIQRGHFHTACRMLPSTTVAPDAAPDPAFFLATQDGAGGETPDTVTIEVPGLPAGTAQCAVWAGDGSHRLPMMQRANQTPAFDAVRVTVG